MSSEAMFRLDEENTRTEDETFENIVDLKTQISRLSVENESYKQQLHDLHRKLETNATMQLELVESNEALEQSLKEHKAAIGRRINEVEEKHIARRKELEERIEEVEAELAEKSKNNKALCEKIKISNDRLSALSKAQCSTSKEDNSELLRCQIEEFNELLAQEREIRKELEATIECRESQCNEMREILTASKSQQQEKDKVLEGMRDQLMTYRIQLESSKVNPESECKGNSLFAEVEDRRRMTLEQMNAMRNVYLEAKRSFQAKEAEIRSLKAERAIFLRKWEDDSVERVQQNANLFDKYKARITELEKQLKDEKKKHTEAAKNHQLPESHFTFLQSLVDAKKKEVEELRTKIENESINALLEEEAKHKMGKQLRYWRFRAMTSEAQLLSIKNRLESDPSSSNVEILETIKTLASNVKEIESNESIGIEASYREVTMVDETVTTLDNLMMIPKPIIPRSTESTLSYLHSIDETSDTTLHASSCESSVLSSTKTTEITEGLSMIDKSNTKSRDAEHGEVVFTVKTGVQTTNVRERDASSTDRASSEPSSVASISVTPILKSVLAKPNADLSAFLSSKETIERDKKTLRFTADTLDPPSKTLKKQAVDKPKYPIIFISSNKSKD